ncbi:MAG TPA: cupin domain-containing protein [Candidatus Limnocylindria bacterium]|nr:cupin domain-containing protein [Candidatus Limnocylindria bacterium]
MATITTSKSGALRAEMDAYTGWHTSKAFDWDAFPASKGFPELSRAQMRYVGAGGSPKADDPTTLRPAAFTLSLVHQPVGKFGATHAHEVEEAFLVLEGVLTVGWEWDGDVIEAKLGPRDMVLHATDRPHGFRNDGPHPVLVSIQVASGKPRPPVYTFHPRDTEPAVAAAFGAQPGHTFALDPGSDDPRHQLMARHVVRYSQQRPAWHPAGFARQVYIGDGGAPPRNYREDLIHLPAGRGVQAYERSVEDVYFVLRGVLTVGWEDDGIAVEQRLGPKDLIFNPKGRVHSFRNDGVEPAEFMMVVGTGRPEDVRFQAAS